MTGKLQLQSNKARHLHRHTLPCFNCLVHSPLFCGAESVVLSSNVPSTGVYTLPCTLTLDLWCRINGFMQLCNFHRRNLPCKLTLDLWCRISGFIQQCTLSNILYLALTALHTHPRSVVQNQWFYPAVYPQ